MGIFTETILYPFAGLKKISSLNRLPDRRVSKDRRGHPKYDERDPIRGAGRGESLYQALGIYAHEETRVELYENYAEMDFDAMISQIIDTYAAEASQLDPETKRRVWPKARNTEILKIVDNCLKRINADRMAFPYMRSLARDGDVFTHIAAARNQGVIALKPYNPWQVARVEDGIGRLTGFAPADENGRPSKVEANALPFWRVLHFRLPARSPSEDYGATSGFLWGSRIKWRELQLMLDQVVIQRLLRRPDRLLIMLDTSGLSHDESYMLVKEWERRLHREWFLNPDQAQFLSQGIPLDIAKDVILPRGPNNQTEIQNFPATNTNDLLRDLEFFYRALANGIGYPYGYLRGEGGNYNAGQSLARQHYPFAMRAGRLQQAFLEELVRCCMIDLAFNGLDITAPENQFELHMSSVSPIMDLERQELMQMKMERMERALRLGSDAGVAPEKWNPFVLKNYGGFSDDVLKEFFPNSEIVGGTQKQYENRGTTLRRVRDNPQEVMAMLKEQIDTLFPKLEQSGMAGSDMYPAEAWNQLDIIKPGANKSLNEAFEDDPTAKYYMESEDTSDDVGGRESRMAFAKMRQKAVVGLVKGKFWEELEAA